MALGPEGRKLFVSPPNLCPIMVSIQFALANSLPYSPRSLPMPPAQCQRLTFIPQNKTSSAVQLKHSASGIVLKVQATRSRTQNRKLARQMLADRLEDIEKGDQSRSAIKMAVKQKRKSSATKKTRRKYRKLEEEKLAGHEGAGKEE